MACPRQALYRMMDFADSEPMSRRLRQTATLGKAIESDIVVAWANAGMLLSSNDPNNQTGFERSDAWLTSSVDAVIRPKGWNKPLVVELKQRKAEIVKKMQLGAGPFPEHVSQIKVQIAMLRDTQIEGQWLDDLDLCTHGNIYYVSRDDPLETAEFRIDYDENFYVAGIEKLKRWRAYFEEDVLPELNPGKRSSKFGHPNGWRWSYSPCQFCTFKKVCQLDFREGRTQLSDSIGVDRTKTVRPDYDAETARLRVRARWSPKKAEA
jgi:CRISPR/Cas system-associated exonuclease Cas4 (RecB family)